MESLLKSRLLIALPVIQQLPLIIHPRLTHFLASQIEVNIHCYPTTPDLLMITCINHTIFQSLIEASKEFEAFFRGSSKHPETLSRSSQLSTIFPHLSLAAQIQVVCLQLQVSQCLMKPPEILSPVFQDTSEQTDRGR